MEETGTNLTVFIFDRNRVFRGLTLRGFSRTFTPPENCMRPSDRARQHRLR